MRNALAFLMVLAALAFPAAALSAPDDVAKAQSCKYCGMDREKFSHSRMMVEYDDGSMVGTCSIHCLATELANSIDKAPVKILVGDYNTKELIDAETAVWVVGGEKAGVMTSRPKWAFAKKEDAEAFIAANKGQTAGFEDVIKAAYEDMYNDTKAIRERRKAKKMKAMEAGQAK